MGKMKRVQKTGDSTLISGELPEGENIAEIGNNMGNPSPGQQRDYM